MRLYFAHHSRLSTILWHLWPEKNSYTEECILEYYIFIGYNRASFAFRAEVLLSKSFPSLSILQSCSLQSMHAHICCICMSRLYALNTVHIFEIKISCDLILQKTPWSAKNTKGASECRECRARPSMRDVLKQMHSDCEQVLSCTRRIGFWKPTWAP